MSGATKLIRIKRAIPHPKYSTISKYHDIALFELAKNVQFDEFVRPACLNTNINITWSNALASGYGQLSYGNCVYDLGRHMSAFQVSCDFFPFRSDSLRAKTEKR